MNDQAKNVPINIPIQTDDDALVPSDPHDDDVIEIDGDAVDFEEDLASLGDMAAEQPIAEPPIEPEPEPEPVAQAAEPIVADFDPYIPPVTAEMPVTDDFDPYIFPEPDVPPTVDAEPIDAEPVAEEEDDDDKFELFPTIDARPAAAAAAPPPEVEEPAAESAKSSEISREAVFEMMNELRQKTEQIARLTDEKTELYDRMLRRQAEFENFRKRGEREMQDAYVRARSDIVVDLLPIIDNFDLALHHAENASADVIHEGVVLIYKQLMDTLGRLGLEAIDAEGQPFDPELHDAVATEQSEEVPDHTVVSVLQRGFKLGDRMLRPARVKVAVQP